MRCRNFGATVRTGSCVMKWPCIKSLRRSRHSYSRVKTWLIQTDGHERVMSTRLALGPCNLFIDKIVIFIRDRATYKKPGFIRNSTMAFFKVASLAITGVNRTRLVTTSSRSLSRRPANRFTSLVGSARVGTIRKATTHPGATTRSNGLVSSSIRDDFKPETDFAQRLGILGALNDDYVRAEKRANTFVQSLMKAKFDDVDGTSQMKVLRGIYDIETENPNVNVIARNVTVKFWESCIEKVNTPGVQYRVAAIGSAGIGKTHATAILIRLLLEAGQTVVYDFRTRPDGAFLYEFSGRTGWPYSAKVYRGITNLAYIPSLQLDSTYYVVDADGTNENCNPSPLFRSKVIIVASLDSRKWGHSDFTKLRTVVKGYFKVYPLWTLDELVDAQPFICPNMTKEEVVRRFRLFGGVPRNIFGGDEHRLAALQDQVVNELRREDVESIVLGFMDAVGSFHSQQPKSPLIGYDLAPDDNGMFEKDLSVLLSVTVKEKVYSRYIRFVWNIATGGTGNGPIIFESYTRSLFAGPSGTSVSLYVRDSRDGKLSEHPFLRCHEVQMGGDLSPILLNPRTKSGVLYHSSSANHKLFDAGYRDDNTKRIYALQYASSQSHSSTAKHILEFLESMSTMSVGWQLYLVYLVPSEKFHSFKLKDDLFPLLGGFVDRIKILHAAVANPSLQPDELLAQLEGRSHTAGD
jgi:hypothetical protein